MLPNVLFLIVDCLDEYDKKVYDYYSTHFPKDKKPGAMKKFDWNLIEKIGGIENKVVLNEGCSYPLDELKNSEKAKKWVAVDFCDKTITKCKKIINRENLSFEVQDIRKLPYHNETFDIILSFSTIDHIKHGRKAVHKECYRILKKGGYYIITVPNILYPTFIQEIEQFGYEYSYHPDELKKELKDAGFTVIFFDDMTHDGTGARMGCICIKGGD